MKRRKKSIIISKPQRELFIRSKIDAEQAWLLDILKKDEFEKVYRTDFEDLDVFNASQVNFIKNVFKKYTETISEQWYRASEMIERDDAICELCGKKHAKWMYYIVNKSTCEKMIVGSNCITEFKGVDLILGKYAGVQEFNRAQKKKMEELRRIEAFTAKFGNVNQMLSEWDGEHERRSYEISATLHEQYTECLKGMKKIFSRIQKKLGNQDYLEFEALMESRKVIAEEIHMFEQWLDDQSYKCPKYLSIALIKSGKAEIVQAIRNNNGLISERTITEITEERYIQSYFEDMKTLFSKTKITLSSFDSNYVSLLYNNRAKRITLEMRMPLREFTRNFAPMMFDENAIIEEQKILEKAEVVGENSLSKLTWLLEKSIGGSQYRILERNEDLYLQREDGMYANRTNVSVFVDKKKWHLINDKSVIQFIDRIVNWDSIENLDKYEYGSMSQIPNSR